MPSEGKVIITAKNNTREGLNSAKQDLFGFEEAARKVGDTLKNAFTVLAVFEGLKKLAEGAIDCVNEFGSMERTMLQLKTALGGNEKSFERLSGLIDEMAKKTLEPKDSIEKLVAELASLGKSDAEIDKITRASIALSNVTGKDLNSAFQLINATYAGSAGKLDKLVPEIGNLTKAQLEAGTAVDILNAKFTAISDSMATGISPKINNLGKSFSELKEGFGRGLTPIFSPWIDGITSLIDKWAEGIKATNDYRDNVAKAAKGDQIAILEVQKANLETKAAIAKSNWQMAYNQEIAAGGTATTALEAAKALQLVWSNIDLQVVSVTNQIKSLKEKIPDRQPSSSSSGSAKSAPEEDNSFYSAHSYNNHAAWEGTIQAMGEIREQSALTVDQLVAQMTAEEQMRNEIEGPMSAAFTKLTTLSSVFHDAWAGTLASLKSKFQEWGNFATGIGNIISESIGEALMTVGENLASGQDDWSNLGKVAVQALASILKSLAAQLAGLAAIHLLSGDFIGAAAAGVAAGAALVASGAASYWASTMGGSTSTTTDSKPASSGSSYSPTGAAASYSGGTNYYYFNVNNSEIYGDSGIDGLFARFQTFIERNRYYGAVTA